MSEEDKQLKENYERIYNENCKLRENHNINDISLLDENEQLKEKIGKAIEYIKNKQEDINNGGNDMSYRQLTALLEILGGNNGEIN